MKGIVWLASYPKSGNTWFRSFISNLTAKDNEETNINKMKTDGIASGVELFEEATGIEASDLTADEIDNIRPEVYKYVAAEAKRELYVKIHDAYTFLKNNEPLIPEENSKAVYILRNPLDVAVSLSFHLSCDIDTAIKAMGNNDFCFCGKTDRFHSQLRQRLLTWSNHVESWVDKAKLPVHVMRYEDMKNDPFETFYKAALFMELPCNEEKIDKAIKASDFKVLKAQEKASGFKEKPAKMNSFFRSGNIGDWREHLSEEQVKIIINDHKEVMKRFGYIDEKGNIIY